MALKVFRGFTLIELVVVIAVLGLVGLVTANILLDSYETNRKASDLNNATTSGNLVLEMVKRSVYGSELATVASCTSSTLTLTTGTSTTVYGLSASQVTKSSDGGAPFTITPPNLTVSSLSFCVRTLSGRPPLVEMGLTVVWGTATTTLQTTAGLRTY